MSLYTKYILPKYLNWTMKDKSLGQYREGVVSSASGVGLEVGFGSGLNLPYYKNVTKLYALEPSEELYSFAKKSITEASFPVEHMKASAENIPIPDNSIDFVISTWSLCSVECPGMTLREIYRILKPGGTFSFVEHGKSPKTHIFTVQNILTPISRRVSGNCHLNRDIENLITEAGFEVDNMEQFSMKSKPLAFMYKGTVSKSNKGRK